MEEDKTNIKEKNIEKISEKDENSEAKINNFKEEKKDEKNSKNKEGKSIYERRIVVPGESITSERKKLGENVFIREGIIYSEVLGLLYENPVMASVVALKGSYYPKMNDIIVGIVVEEKFSGYTVAVNSFYNSFVSKRDLDDELIPGDIISAKVKSVSVLNEMDLTNVRSFRDGDIIKISPVKIPRLIGKGGSMLNVIKDGTKANLVVGRNGFIWTKGGNQKLVSKAIEKIENEAHLPNLTNKMTEFLKNNA